MLKLSHSAYISLRQHGEETYPHECCGVLLGRFDDDSAKTVRASPAAATRARTHPTTATSIDPSELIRIQREGRERGEDIVGFYHSHPDHPAQWSTTDLAEPLVRLFLRDHERGEGRSGDYEFVRTYR